MFSNLENTIEALRDDVSFSLSDNYVCRLGELMVEHTPIARHRVFPPEVTLSAMMHQVLTPKGSLRTTLVKINAERFAAGLGPISTNTGSLARARSRLPTEVIATLAKEQYGNIPKSEFIYEWLWHGVLTARKCKVQYQ